MVVDSGGPTQPVLGVFLMKKIFLTGIAALSVLASAAHADWGNPWEEADGPNRIYILLRTVACGLGEDVQRFAIWQPYDLAAKKTLDFYRVTPELPPKPLKGKATFIDGQLAIDGEKCVEWPGKGG
jgi:hypothetical protein